MNKNGIPEGWEEVKLKDLLKAKGYIRGPFGSALKRDEMKTSGVPVYEQQNAIYNNRNFRYFIEEEKHKKLQRFTVSENDLIISCSGTVGKVSIINKEDPIGIISQALLILRPDLEIVNPRFLYYFFTSRKGYNSLLSRSGGSVQVNLAKRKVVEDIMINLPLLSEQKKIAEILSSLDDKIELNNQINKNLENMAQTIFKQWFVDFEFPDENGNPYASSGGELVESEMGLIPEGWRVGALDEIANYQNGLALQKFRPKDENYFLPVLKIADLQKGYPNYNEKADINIKDECKVFDGDVIFSWSGTLMVDIWCGGHAALNQHLFKVTSDKFFKWFYYYWTKKHLDNFKRIAADKAVTMGHIKRGHLAKAKCFIPNENVMNSANEVIEPLLNSLINNRIENKNLVKLRDSLLPKLMSGEIRVGDFKE